LSGWSRQVSIEESTLTGPLGKTNHPRKGRGGNQGLFLLTNGGKFPRQKWGGTPQNRRRGGKGRRKITREIIKGGKNCSKKAAGGKQSKKKTDWSTLIGGGGNTND